MVLKHIWGLFTSPKEEWAAIRDEDCDIKGCYVRHTFLYAAIPAISGFIGTTQIGWEFGYSGPVKLTVESAWPIALAYYVVMLAGVFCVGAMIKWMGKTYQADRPLSQAVALSSYTATPLFLIGIFELYPILWLNFVVGLFALSYTVYLLYSGLPIMMDVSEERGFLFSSAVLAVGLVVLVSMMAATAILWGLGLGPSFTTQ